MACPQHWTGTTWEPDPLILDDQALVVNVRGKGLVIVTGCGHAGAVNIVRHAQRLTGVPRLHALLGGLHLGGAFLPPSIGPTVHALTEVAPDLLVPGHCTGWRATHPRRCATRQLDPRQQRHPLPAHLFLTLPGGRDLACPGHGPQGDR
jgi:metal-dependent hydrolase (beta-lactamase superfamily II)